MKKVSIIILHGWGLSGKKFNDLAQELTTRGYGVFTPDLPGFGESPIPDRAYYLIDYANFLKDYIKANSIQDAIVIGHSFGGRIALKFLHKQYEGVKGIIFTGTPGYTPVARSRLQLFILIAKIGKLIASIWPISILQDKIRAWYYFTVGARDFYRASGVMREIFKHIVQEDLSSTISSVKVPCAIVWGQNDQITPVWIANRMHETILHSTLSIIDDADHGVSYKQPIVFANHVDTFLKSL